jgi:hypothetical protein
MTSPKKPLTPSQVRIWPMTYVYTQLSLIARLGAFHAALALVSLLVFCAPNAKADVIYSYVAANSPTCSVGGNPACAYNAGTTFTIDSPGFLPFAATPFTYTPVTTADDLYIWPDYYGQLLDVIFLDPSDIGAVAPGLSGPGFLWSAGTAAQEYNPEVAGVYTDAVGDTLTVTVTTPEPYTAVLSLTGTAAGIMEALRRRLAGSRR